MVETPASRAAAIKRRVSDSLHDRREVKSDSTSVLTDSRCDGNLHQAWKRYFVHGPWLMLQIRELMSWCSGIQSCGRMTDDIPSRRNCKEARLKRLKCVHNPQRVHHQHTEPQPDMLSQDKEDWSRSPSQAGVRHEDELTGLTDEVQGRQASLKRPGDSWWLLDPEKAGAFQQ